MAKYDKVKRVVVYYGFYLGGLKMVNVENFIKSLKCTLIKKKTKSNQPCMDIFPINGHDVVQ